MISVDLEYLADKGGFRVRWEAMAIPPVVGDKIYHDKKVWRVISRCWVERDRNTSAYGPRPRCILEVEPAQ